MTSETRTSPRAPFPSFDVRGADDIADGTPLVDVAVVSGPYSLLLLLAITAGMVRGKLTLLHATAVTDRWGH